MKSWTKTFGAGAASGLLLALAMPLAGWAALGWVCLMPLLLATRGEGGLKGFGGGIVAAMVGGWASTTPLVGAPAIEGGTHAWTYVGFGLYGLVVAVFAGVCAELKEVRGRTVLLLACFAVALELLTFVRLPAHLALSQYAVAPAMAVASVAGIWGVSWLLWLANASVLLSAPSRPRVLAVVGAAAVASQLFAWHHLGGIDPRAIAARDPGQVGLLQTEQVGADALLELQRPLDAVRPSWVVWPELSALASDAPALEAFGRSPEGWPVVAGFLDDAAPKPHNVAQVFGPDGPSKPYHKRKPFADERFAIRAGDRPVTVTVMRMDVGLNICFDSCYPWIMRDTVRQGADVIALPTLDPKSPNGFIQAAHGAFTTFRAAELGVPIVRAEHTAWSMVVSPSGRLTAKAPVGWEGALARPLPKRKPWTVYLWLGDWFLFACLAALAVWVARAVGGRLRSLATLGRHASALV